MIFRVIIVLGLTALTALVASLVWGLEGNHLNVFLISVLGVFVLSSLVVLLESFLHFQSPKKAVVSLIGIFLGAFVGYAIGQGLGAILQGLVPADVLKGIENTGPIIGYLLSFVSVVAFGWLGGAVGFVKAEDLGFLGGGETHYLGATESGENLKILDTSVIIDGRIADIAATGFLEGILVVPRFVLRELQQVADSGDGVKRSRGRRGLDILNQLKGSKHARIKITDTDFDETREVDNKLLLLAKQIGGVVITNDYNLNKVAGIQGVKVLNINDLANALRPVVLPNEELRITVMREGKDPRQGVAYLDDGTMIVVDNGAEKIGQEVDVVVTSFLQTESGRMIFTELVSSNKNRDITPNRRQETDPNRNRRRPPTRVGQSGNSRYDGRNG